MSKLKILLGLCLLMLAACSDSEQVKDSEQDAVPAFNAESAYAYCEAQCNFGPRTMNSEAHDLCCDWIKKEFEKNGCKVELQSADFRCFDGTILKSTNIIASIYPERKERIMLCAHYDSRPWADNDPDPINHNTPVLAANDGASGIAVMLEIARLMSGDGKAKVGVDFICFDAEDSGAPDWVGIENEEDDSWALGAQYWAQSIADGGYRYKPRYGILLDMVGGENSHFYWERKSLAYAPDVVDKVWAAARTCGVGDMFPMTKGCGVIDDHVPVNDIAKIPCIDIIPYNPELPKQAPFHVTWHTVNDTMEHISRETLKAVGQTILQVIFTEE